jgi:hypothetical protein
MPIKRKKKSLGEFCVLSTVSVPKKQLDHYKELSLDDNTGLFELIYKKIEETPLIMEEEAESSVVRNFKLRIESKERYIALTNKLKEHKKKTGNFVSLSKLYLKYYDEYLATKKAKRLIPG